MGANNPLSVALKGVQLMAERGNKTEKAGEKWRLSKSQMKWKHGGCKKREKERESTWKYF